MLDRLKNLIRRNPTRDFPRSRIAPSFNLTDGSLCNQPIGSAFSRFEILGPADACRFPGENWMELDYYALGIHLGFSDGNLDEVSIIFDPWAAQRDGFQPTACHLRFPGGESINATRATTEADVEAILGQPDDRAPVVGRPTLEYLHAGGTHALFEFSPDRRHLVQASFLEPASR